jgi:hypothetical protein
MSGSQSASVQDGGYRRTPHRRTSHWLLPGALRHVVQVHMTGDDWQSLPAQQLTSLTLLVYPSGSRGCSRVRGGSDHVPSSI